MSSSQVPGAAVGALAGLAAAVDALAADDLAALPDAAAAERVLALRALIERAEGEWLRCLAAVDARGAAGAEAGARFGSTAGWLRAAARMSPRSAGERVRAARALHRGRLPAVADALAAGEISHEHAAAIAAGLAGLPREQARAAEPIVLGVAREQDPATTRRVVEHLRHALDPDGEDERGRRRHDRRGLRLSTTWEGMLGVDGLLDPEAGEVVLAAVNALAKPGGPDDDRSAAQRRADALTELARRALDTGQLPATGGARPHMSIVVDLEALLAANAADDAADAAADAAADDAADYSAAAAADDDAAAAAETLRRIACDAEVTRIVVRRRDGDPGSAEAGSRPERERAQAILRAALAALPPALGGPSAEPLDVGRASRVATAAQRRALAVRDGGCRFPGCDCPPIWCEPHHWRVHWLDGGRTDLDNLVLLCRRHHRAVHEGGWTIHRDRTGRFIFTPRARAPARGPTAARAA